MVYYIEIFNFIEVNMICVLALFGPGGNGRPPNGDSCPTLTAFLNRERELYMTFYIEVNKDGFTIISIPFDVPIARVELSIRRKGGVLYLTDECYPILLFSHFSRRARTALEECR